MKFDKRIFSLNLQSKNYYFCIDMLRSEIISILSEKIKEKNPQFVYTTVRSLKNNCMKYLSESEQSIAIEIYNFSFSDNASEYELSRMMDLYKQVETLI